MTPDAPARQERGTERRAPIRRAPLRKPGGKPNYRLLLCIALLVCFLLAVLFFGLFLRRGGTIKELETQVATLTERNKTLEFELTSLQSASEAALTAAVAQLPEPTTAQTDTLPDLIPQLTGTYVVRSTGSGYQYLQIPDGAVKDQLNAYRSALTESPEAGAATCDMWVLYDDAVVGLMSSGGAAGFYSADRTAQGTGSVLPDGFAAFVATLF